MKEFISYKLNQKKRKKKMILPVAIITIYSDVWNNASAKFASVLY